jgi:hypothetical protein
LEFGQEVYFDSIVDIEAIPGETVATKRLRLVSEANKTQIIGWASLTGRSLDDQDPILSILSMPAATARSIQEPVSGSVKGLGRPAAFLGGSSSSSPAVSKLSANAVYGSRSETTVRENPTISSSSVQQPKPVVPSAAVTTKQLSLAGSVNRTHPRAPSAKDQTQQAAVGGLANQQKPAWAKPGNRNTIRFGVVLNPTVGTGSSDAVLSAPTPSANFGSKFCCPLCDMDITSFDIMARNHHINRCSDAIGAFDA